MTRILILDYDAERIKEIAEKYDIEEWQVIERMLENIDRDEEDMVFE